MANRIKGNPARASYMQNMRVTPGVVVCRPGTSAVFPTGAKVTGMHNWITPANDNLVLYQEGAYIKRFRQSDGNFSLLQADVTCRAPVFADLDVWSYFAGFDTSGNGTQQAMIYDGTNVDIAFAAAPTLTTATGVQGATGNCTAGTRNIGFVYQNRNGRTCPLITQIAGAAFSVTLNAGLLQINISVDMPAMLDGGTNPTGASATLFLAATRTDSTGTWYYVPPAAGGNATVEQQPVPYNSAGTLSFVMDISDEDLAASADPISGPNANPDLTLILSQDSSGNGPFSPAFIVPYGQRMCYGAGGTLWVSDINVPQTLRAADSFVNMPSMRVIAMAFPVPGSTGLFLTGEGWTSSVIDNSNTPSTWAEPVSVSEELGAPFPNCVCYKTAGGYSWVATEGGVYQFNGVYPSRPITFLCSDLWARVNWAAAYAIEMADDTVNLRLYVAVPLDGATEPTHQFVIDYTNGSTFNTCDIGLDIFARTSGTFSSIAAVKENTDERTNLWIGPSEAGAVVRFDSTTHNDLTW